ncbi:ribonuclease R [Sesbania bispinosa]|nr:ribonuclease R [Sesbania bispinosa]
MPSPRLGWRMPTPRDGWRKFNNLCQVPDLVGECRLPESVGGHFIIYAKSQTLLANADSKSRLENIS